MNFGVILFTFHDRKFAKLSILEYVLDDSRLDFCQNVSFGGLLFTFHDRCFAKMSVLEEFWSRFTIGILPKYRFFG